MLRSSVRVLAAASLLSVVLAAAEGSQREVPIAGFYPSQPVSLVGACMFFLTTVVMWMHFHRSGRPWYLIVLPISMTTMTGGFLLRFYYNNHAAELKWYIPFYTLLLLSPCGFIAAVYIILPRLGRAMGDEIRREAFLVRVNWIVKFFIGSDVVTFLIQAGAGGLMAGGDPDKADLGNKMMLVGLIAQLISFSFFVVVLLVFGWRVSRNHSHLVHPNTPFRLNRFNPLSSEPIADWRIMFGILVVVCIGIVVRSVFRILEGVDGHGGYLAVHEVYFYLFDALPLWLAMSLLAYVWPPRVIEGVAMPDGVSRFENRHSALRRLPTDDDSQPMAPGGKDDPFGDSGAVPLGRYDPYGQYRS